MNCSIGDSEPSDAQPRDNPPRCRADPDLVATTVDRIDDVAIEPRLVRATARRPAASTVRRSVGANHVAPARPRKIGPSLRTAIPAPSEYVVKTRIAPALDAVVRSNPQIPSRSSNTADTCRPVPSSASAFAATPCRVIRTSPLRPAAIHTFDSRSRTMASAGKP